MSNGWARAYTTGEQRHGTPHGRISGKPFQGGQKIGAGNLSNNFTFAGQAQAPKVLRIAEYAGTVVNRGEKMAVIDLSTPSNRITTGISFFLERKGTVSQELMPYGGTLPVGYAWAMGVNPQTGQRSPMQVIQTFQPPYGFQVDPAYRNIRIILQLECANWPTSSSAPGGVTLVCSVNWEPSVEMSQAELNRLISECAVSATPTLSFS